MRKRGDPVCYIVHFRRLERPVARIPGGTRVGTFSLYGGRRGWSTRFPFVTLSVDDLTSEISNTEKHVIPSSCDCEMNISKDPGREDLAAEC